MDFSIVKNLSQIFRWRIFPNFLKIFLEFTHSCLSVCKPHKSWISSLFFPSDFLHKWTLSIFSFSKVGRLIRFSVEEILLYWKFLNNFFNPMPFVWLSRNTFNNNRHRMSAKEEISHVRTPNAPKPLSSESSFCQTSILSHLTCNLVLLFNSAAASLIWGAKIRDFHSYLTPAGYFLWPGSRWISFFHSNRTYGSPPDRGTPSSLMSSIWRKSPKNHWGPENDG